MYLKALHSFLLPGVLWCHTIITFSSIYKTIDRLNAFYTFWLGITRRGLAGNTSKDKSLQCVRNVMRHITTQNYHRLPKMAQRKWLTVRKWFLSVCIKTHHSVFTAQCSIHLVGAGRRYSCGGVLQCHSTIESDFSLEVVSLVRDLQLLHTELVMFFPFLKIDTVVQWWVMPP